MTFSVQVCIEIIYCKNKKRHIGRFQEQMHGKELIATAAAVRRVVTKKKIYIYIYSLC
jgi:hypothetical protein